ncbi:SRPBCC domain-containing protein [Caulobacter sp. 17J65-9]|uniref:SRPBCC domain-containing protein n=1 Tax=Caulobacter sp. 17J65-9 TaxID=2709382 RepID=UPI0013C57BA8|nr:SRPBCC domain-containing protein [Caulobacter sp. 17J65-9]NEX92329.1 SRPBCC domain-containing protein [Caulobacter sp. 17J65-9]
MAFRVEYRIGIKATSDAIWEVLSDLEFWGTWNPIHPKASGKIGIGQPLALRETIPGLPERDFNATVVEWVPRQQLIWAEKRGFMSRSVRYFEIEELDPGSCIFAIGEIFEGALGEVEGKRTKRVRKAAFEQLAEALRAKVEA